MREYGKGLQREFDFNGWLGESLFLQGKTLAAASVLVKVLSGKENYASRQTEFHFLDNHARFHCVLGWLEGERGELAEGLGDCRAAFAEHEAVLAQRQGEPRGGQRQPMEPGGDRPVPIPGRKIGREEWIARAVQNPRTTKTRRPGEIQGTAIRQRSGFVGGRAGRNSAGGGTGQRSAGRRGRSSAGPRAVGRGGHTRQPGTSPDGSSQLRVPPRVWAELLARKGEALRRPASRRMLPRPSIAPSRSAKTSRSKKPCYLYDLAHHLTLASTLPGEDAQTLTDRA